MKLQIYQIDAFAERVFQGNPAAVVPLEHELEDDLLQSIAAENNLSETAFILRREDSFSLRWFTPVSEVDLCGHATLASAFYLFESGEVKGDRVSFETRSGTLHVLKNGRLLTLDFPARPPHEVAMKAELSEALNSAPDQLFESERDWLALFGDEESVRQLKPDFGLLGRIPVFAVIVTAPGTDVDFVSRFFAPRLGIPEDPVTGSAHSTLVPFWSSRLGKATYF